MVTRTGRTTRGAFTLIEILVSILIIIVLMGLLIVAVRHAIGFTKGNRDRAQVTALKNAVTHFNSEFHFNPLLVKDFDALGPVKNVGGRYFPNVYSASNPTDALRLRNQDPGTPANPDIRFSTYSLPYYVIGALDKTIDGSGNTPPIDGVEGLGFLTPKRDGTFEKSGRKFDPFFDVGKNAKSLFVSDINAGRVSLRDANEVPIRYYHWLQGDAANGNRVAKPDDANIPEILYRLPGDTATKASADLLSADWAIVAAGPNGVYGDEADLLSNPQAVAMGITMSWDALATKAGVSADITTQAGKDKVRAAAMKDNIVEVGK